MKASDEPTEIPDGGWEAVTRSATPQPAAPTEPKETPEETPPRASRHYVLEAEPGVFGMVGSPIGVSHTPPE